MLRANFITKLTKDKNQLFYSAFFIVVLIVYTIFQFRHLNLDFWNDENFTFKYFTFVPFKSIVTEYPEPNNHIFLNLINKVYLKLLGIDEFFEVFNAPYKLRFLQLFYSISAFAYLFVLGRKFFNDKIATIAVILLATCMGYFTHALQIRGYGLSTLLLVMLVFYCMKYWDSLRNRYLLFVGLLTALLMYTVPSNMLSIAGLVFFFLSYSVSDLIFNGSKSKRLLFFLQPSFKVLLAVTGGILLSLLMYAPIFKDVFANDFVKSQSPFNFSQITLLVKLVFSAFISNKFILGAISFIGLGHINIFKGRIPFFLLPVCILFFPFVMVLMIGSAAPDRVFVPIATMFCLVSAIGIYGCVSWFVKSESAFKVAMVLLMVYCFFSFKTEVERVNTSLLRDIETGKRSQDIYCQYYSAHFRPLNEMRYFKKHYYKNEMPVLQIECEGNDLPHYLDKLEINRFKGHQLGEIKYEESHYSDGKYKNLVLDSLMNLYDNLYIVTNHPKQFKNSNYSVKILSTTLNYHTIVLFQRNPALCQKVKDIVSNVGNRYRDSVCFVFNTPFSKLFKSFCGNHSAFFINDERKYGALLKAVSEKPYTCFIQTNYQVDDQLRNVLIANHPQICRQEKTADYSYYLLGKRRMTELHNNDFEEKRFKKSKSDQLEAFENSGYELLDKDHVYTSGLNVMFKEAGLTTIDKVFVSLFSKFKSGEGGSLVLEVLRGGQVIHYRSVDMNAYESNTQWKKVCATFDLNINYRPDDFLRVYIWNNKGKQIAVDKMSVAIE